MSLRGEVGPNLMGSARFGNNLQKGKALESFDYPPLSDRGPSLARVDGDPFSLLGMSPQGSFNDPFPFPYFPMDQCDIAFLDLTGPELGRQVMVGRGVFRRDHYARGVLIQAMDNARPDDPVNLGEIPAVEKESIHKGPRINPGAGVNHHARELIDDDNP